MQHLDGSGTPVLYIGRMVLKVNVLVFSVNFFVSSRTRHRMGTVAYCPHYNHSCCMHSSITAA
jgi:hypothetical protein